EYKNIPMITSKLLKMYPGVSIIVADDGSTDGTREEVIAINKKNRQVKLLDRGAKRVHGLSASVIDAALMVKTKYLIVMDADMQHPPDKVSEMMKYLKDYDLVVGVRTHVKNWGIYRKTVSKSIAYFSYVILTIRGKRTCNDIMSGFFGIQTGLFQLIIRGRRSAFISRSYKVLLDLLKLLDKNVKIKEVYYSSFNPRRYGKSKANVGNFIDIIKSSFK
ncbi:MAG: glycosyltransferase, partial [Candidatus Marsarchaeota archaeon]|nr:glycosyltransferase [Candidatus Marsarchaeota archaeon]